MGCSDGDMDGWAARSDSGSEDEAHEVSEKNMNSAQKEEGPSTSHSGKLSVLLCPCPEHWNMAELKGNGLTCMMKEMSRYGDIQAGVWLFSTTLT